MTIEKSRNSLRKFEETLLFHQAEIPQLTMNYLSHEKHIALLSGDILNEKSREKVLHHIADVIVRRGREYAHEKDLTLDDILCIAVGMELKRISEIKLQEFGKRRGGILELLPIPEQMKCGITSRCVDYLMQFVSKPYDKDNKELLADALANYFINVPTRRQINEKSLKLTKKKLPDEKITDRQKAILANEQLQLAVCYLGSDVRITFGPMGGKTAYDSSNF